MTTLQVIERIVLVGVGATAILDAWLGLLARLRVPTLDFAYLGRWVGHLSRGRFFHDAIARSAPVRGELALGWLAHYAIGIAFAALLAGALGTAWMLRPTVAPALAIGVATVIAPLFVMQPAMGAGLASSRTATPVRNVLRSVANHAVFGLGLYACSLLAAQWLR
jgi:hypothetical protein